MASSNATKTVAQLMLQSAHKDLAACALLSTGDGIKDAVVGFHAESVVKRAVSWIEVQIRKS